MIKPEKRIESLIRGWCLQNRIWVEIFDSKAVFSKASGHYKRNQGLRVGCPDMLGLNSQGLFVAIELKAPGKETLCSLEQWQFLERVIQQNGFGAVCSSVESLDCLYQEWLSKRDPLLLLNALPKKVYVRQGKSKKIIPAPSVQQP